MKKFNSYSIDELIMGLNRNVEFDLYALSFTTKTLLWTLVLTLNRMKRTLPYMPSRKKKG